jgi:hypothetical protein
LNPIKLVWAQLKKIVSSRNFTNKLNDVLEITKAAFTEIGVQNWENYCKHVINIEEEYTSLGDTAEVAEYMSFFFRNVIYNILRFQFIRLCQS